MKKNVLRFIILFLIALIIFCVIRFLFMDNSKFDSINYEQYLELENKSGLNIVYIVGDNYYIDEFDKTLQKIFSNKMKLVKKLNITKSENLNGIISNEKFMNYFKDELILPVLIILEDGNIIGSVNYSSEEKIIENLKSLGIEIEEI